MKTLNLLAVLLLAQFSSSFAGEDTLDPVTKRVQIQIELRVGTCTFSEGKAQCNGQAAINKPVDVVLEKKDRQKHGYGGYQGYVIVELPSDFVVKGQLQVILHELDNKFAVDANLSYENNPQTSFAGTSAATLEELSPLQIQTWTQPTRIPGISSWNVSAEISPVKN